LRIVSFLNPHSVHGNIVGTGRAESKLVTVRVAEAVALVEFLAATDVVAVRFGAMDVVVLNSVEFGQNKKGSPFSPWSISGSIVIRAQAGACVEVAFLVCVEFAMVVVAVTVEFIDFVIVALG
jgi:hypothetical protein